MSVLAPAPCRSCRRLVVWAITDRGSRMPVDADPVPSGNVRLTAGVPDARAEVLKGADRAAAVAASEPLHLSHFATCPQAGSWRRK